MGEAVVAELLGDFGGHAGAHLGLDGLGHGVCAGVLFNGLLAGCGGVLDEELFDVWGELGASLCGGDGACGGEGAGEQMLEACAGDMLWCGHGALSW